MIPDEVSGRHNPSRQLGLCLGVAAHKEESRPHIVAGKNVEEPRRPRRVGTIVESKREFAGTARRNQRLAEDARSRPQCCIGTAARRQSDRRAQPGGYLYSDW